MTFFYTVFPVLRPRPDEARLPLSPEVQIPEKKSPDFGFPHPADRKSVPSFSDSRSENAPGLPVFSPGSLLFRRRPKLLTADPDITETDAHAVRVYPKEEKISPGSGQPYILHRLTC